MVRLVNSLLLVICLTSCTSQHYYSLDFRNDVFAKGLNSITGKRHNRDYNDTHDTIISSSISADKACQPIYKLHKNIPVIKIFDDDPDKDSRYITRLGQEIHTPDDTYSTEVVKDDVPYAGYLYTQIVKVQTNEEKTKRIDTSITLGLVGSWSGAEQVQKFIHETLGMGKKLNGWHNQLHNEPILQYDTARYERLTYNNYTDKTQFINYRIGNAHLDYQIGNQYRYGWNLPNLDYTELTGWRFYGFSQYDVNVIARNIFYDGNTFKNSHNVDKIPFTGEIQTGIVLGYKAFEISAKYIFITKEYEEMKDNYSIYGLLTAGINW